MLKKLIWLERSDLHILWIPVGLFALMQLVTGGVMLFGKPDTGVLISPILLLVVGMVLGMILVIGHAMLTFEQALRMGMTRKKSLAQFVGLSAFQCAAILVIGVVLVAAEQLLGRYLWPVLSPGVQIKNFISVIPWWGYPAAFFGSLLIGFIIGAGIQRFGSKFGWGVWALWLVWFFLFDRLPMKQEQVFFGLILGTAILLAGMFVWSVWSYLHAVIKR